MCFTELCIIEYLPDPPYRCLEVFIGIRMKELKKIMGGGYIGYWKDRDHYTAVCMMSPTAKYFVGNKYKTLEEAKAAFIQAQEDWNQKGKEQGFKTFDYQTLIEEHEE